MSGVKLPQTENDYTKQASESVPNIINKTIALFDRVGVLLKPNVIN